jgi:hypothetical protein
VAARDEDVPVFAYTLAVVAGLFFMGVSLMMSGFLADAFGLGPHNFFWAVPAATAVVYTATGAAFGLLWPEKTWRWGVWLCAVPACLVSFLAPGAKLFLLWSAATMLPACAGAYAAGRLHLRYTKVDDSG